MIDRRNFLVSLVCALTLPVVALIIHPWVELSLNDDWSYTRSALVFSQTGHLAYNGWSAAILGWHAVLGAIAIKLFGFSFSIVRATTLLVAMLSAFLFHRILIRCGVKPWPSAIGTLALYLSPLALPLVFSFMTDIGGLFVILLCLYACLRAISASSARGAMAWLAFAALSNLVGGTIRQIAWLGVLVMVPATLWLLRRRHPRIAIPVIAIICLSDVAIFVLIRWFSHQPLTIHEPLFSGAISLVAISRTIGSLCRAALEVLFFLIPVLALFAPPPSRLRRALLLTAVIAVFLFSFGLARYGRHGLAEVLFPYLGNYVTVNGLMAGTPLQGVRPVVLNLASQLLITAAILFAALNLGIFLFDRWRELSIDKPHPPAPEAISWHDLAYVLGPFTLAYLSLLASLGTFTTIFDRYLLPLIAVATLVLLRLYQQHVWPDLHLRRLAFTVSVVVFSVFVAFGILGTHDLFSLLYAESAAIVELRQVNIAPSFIDGGFEFNAWTQIQQTGYVTDGRIFPHTSTPHPSSVSSTLTCKPEMRTLFPSLVPEYALSFDPSLCLGSTAFPPVPYNTWLPLRNNFVYIVRELGQSINSR